MGRIVLLVATTLLASACVEGTEVPPLPSSPQSPEERVVGCYEVVALEWTPAKPLTYRGPDDPPRRFFLSREPLTPLPNSPWRVRPDASHGGYGTWRLTNLYEVEVTWTGPTDAFAGVRLLVSLDMTSGMWRGNAHPIGGPLDRGRIVLHKIADAACRLPVEHRPKR